MRYSFCLVVFGYNYSESANQPGQLGRRDSSFGAGGNCQKNKKWRGSKTFWLQSRLDILVWFGRLAWIKNNIFFYILSLFIISEGFHIRNFFILDIPVYVSLMFISYSKIDVGLKLYADLNPGQSSFNFKNKIKRAFFDKFPNLFPEVF